RFACRRTGGTDSARYCYSVWLRHLVMVHQSGLDTRPKVVAELGPGDSIGTGLAALLTGAETYYALDVVGYANTQANLNIFEELVSLFSERRPIPGRDEFPEITPQLTSCEFPREILSDDRLAEALVPSRIQEIRNALVRSTGVSPVNEKNMAETAMLRSEDAIEIRYFAPWYDAGVIKPESVDMIFSQAVLEHVEDLGGTYEALYRWLKGGGFMSHQIDLSSHGLSKHWNGHWGYSPLTWKLIKGNRPWLLNREPYSTHRDLIEKNGFDIVSELKADDTSGIARNHLAARFAHFTDDDLITRTVYVLARKKA
ncbi:MAG: methyltransferase domain-containing protein, partial [Phycisphaerae bacterium]|nr:methyltransferase domain-containing protein [Phycisphaerae bacterium]